MLQITVVFSMVLFLSGFTEGLLAAEKTTVAVFEKAEIDASEIFLGEIAQIDGNDHQLIQQLKKVVIGKAPLPNRSRIIETGYIKLRLKQNGFDLSELDLQSPPKVEISRSFIEVSKPEMEEIVSNFIDTKALKGNKLARIKNLCVPDGIILPRGRVTYQVFPPRNSTYLGKIPLSIRFSVDGHLRKKVWATVTIEMFVDVVVAKEPLGKHKRIEEDDIVLKKLDLAHLPSNVITDPQAVLGKRTSRSIHPQTVLRTDLIELPPVVKRGDIVVIVAESKGLRITALGKAKRRGGRGERIPVENFDSRKILYAQVIDSRTVKVEF
jgi:flagella basal body P-ring formation protein FlgA